VQRKKSINTDIHNQITVDDSEKKCCGVWEKNVHITKENDWNKLESCRN
jgi:hypothetical protein